MVMRAGTHVTACKGWGRFTVIHMGVFGRPKFGCVSLREGVGLRVDLPWISIADDDVIIRDDHIFGK